MESNSKPAQEIEASDEIPAYTEVPLTDSKIKNINIEKYAAKRVMKLFISHILDTEMVKIHDKLEKHFVFNDITFRTVMIRGVVIGFQFLSFKTKDRTLISVDDGTGVLDCYVEENLFIEDTMAAVFTNINNTVELFKSIESENVMLKAALMVLQSSKEQMTNLPHFKNFQLGDSVLLIGTLSEYCGKRSCFVTSVLKDDSINNARYIEHVLNLYKTVYH